MKTKICLTMIVKDEVKIIARCLASVKPYIDAWAIVDTGSTDGTQDVIRALLKDLPGELIERQWVDFSTNRNQAIELARNISGYEEHVDYALTIDADEVLETHGKGLELADHAKANHFAALPYGYFLNVQYGNTSYKRVALVKLSEPWKWEGVLHEVLTHPSYYCQTTYPATIHVFNDGARSSQPGTVKYAKDAAILEKALEADPTNTRYQFYYAQSLKDCGYLASAIEAYQTRVTMRGWEEEVFISKLEIAKLYERLGAISYADIMAAYLDAYEYRPTRAEPLCELARFCRTANPPRYQQASMFAERAVEIVLRKRFGRMSDILFVDQSVYDWRALDEMAISAYWCGKKDQCKEACENLLLSEQWNLPADQVERVKKNLSFCEEKQL